MDDKFDQVAEGQGKNRVDERRTNISPHDIGMFGETKVTVHEATVIGVDHRAGPTQVVTRSERKTCLDELRTSLQIFMCAYYSVLINNENISANLRLSDLFFYFCERSEIKIISEMTNCKRWI